MSVYISNFLLLLSPNSPFPPPILRNSKRNDRSLVRLNEQKCFDWSGNTLVMHSFTRDFRAGIDAPWKMQHNGGRGGTRAYKNRQMDRGFVLFPRHFKRRNTSSSIVARIGIFPRFFFFPRQIIESSIVNERERSSSRIVGLSFINVKNNVALSFSILEIVVSFDLIKIPPIINSSVHFSDYLATEIVFIVRCFWYFDQVTRWVNGIAPSCLILRVKRISNVKRRIWDDGSKREILSIRKSFEDNFLIVFSNGFSVKDKDKVLQR